MNDLKQTLINLDNAHGASGDEEAVADVLKKEMEGLYDEHFVDNMGNNFFIKNGTSDKKILFAGHMDEIGFIINYITDNGFIKVLPVGYHDDRAAFNQDIVFRTRDGKLIYGITTSKPFHSLSEEERKKLPTIEELFIDIGVSSKEEAIKLGIQIGDYGTFARKGRFLNNSDYYSGPSVDNRSALAVMVDVLKKLKGEKISPTIAMVGTVQEEVGMRAGGPITNNFKPDIMLALDLTLTGDMPGEENTISVKLGGGPAVKFFDWDGALGMTGNNVPRKLTNALIDIAEKNKIPYQREVMTGGGTDAWSAQMAGSGFLSGGICIPSRYIHTALGTVKISDIEKTSDFVIAVIKELTL